MELEAKNMYGAILGDMIGSPYEFDRSGKTKDFPLFIPASRYTDDSAMTIAVAEALLDNLVCVNELFPGIRRIAWIRIQEPFENKWISKIDRPISA